MSCAWLTACVHVGRARYERAHVVPFVCAHMFARSRMCSIAVVGAHVRACYYCLMSLVRADGTPIT